MLRPIPYTTLSYDPNKHKFYTTDNKEVKGILVIKTIFMGNVRKFENNDFIVTVDVVTERSPLM